MASLNWLGFSLSQQDILPQENHQDVASDSSAPSFGILEDWNMKGAMEMNSMLSSTCNQDQPKLENFLGSSHSSTDTLSYNHTYTNSDDYSYMVSNGSLQSGTTDNSQSNNNGINVSMIKTWLRNQPPTVNKTHITSAQAQTLSLSMGGAGLIEHDSSKELNDNREIIPAGLDAQSGAIEAVPKKSADTFGQRTSIYRGVTRHRWTGRYEAHLWDNSVRREGQTRKGRQVYLGGYDKEEKAARSYDLAAIKYWGTNTTTNFPISNYEKEIEDMKNMTRQEFIASLRRKSSGFSRGASIYRGVTRHHQQGRWQARIGRVAGNKDLYLGTFTTQEEAAEAYDIAAIKFRGLNAVTNFEMNRYDVKAIIESSALPIGGAAKRLKEAEELTAISNAQRSMLENSAVSQLNDGISLAGYNGGWPAIAFQQAQPLSMQYQYSQQPRLTWCKQEEEYDTTSSSFQDHRLQLSNTQNVFHHPSYNLMGLDSSSMEQSSESNSGIYGGGGDSVNGGYGGNNGMFLTPMGDDGGNGIQMNGMGHENMLGSANWYYHQHANGFDHQGSTYKL